MPPRDQALPEGTDKIINGASETRDTSGASGGNGSPKGAPSPRSGSAGGTAFVASGGGNDTGGATDRIVGQVREQVTSLRDQATDRARQLAEGSKDKTTSLLDDLSEIIHDAARSIDERLGDQYGEYAHRAGDAVGSLAGNLREKSLEDLLDGTRSIVRKSPAVTVGTAALLGFVLIRLVKSGLEDVGGRGGGGGSGRKSGGSGGGA